ERRPTPALRPAEAGGAAEEARARRRVMTAALLLQAAGLANVNVTPPANDPTGAAWQKLGDDLRAAWFDRLPRQVRESAAKQEWAVADRLARFPPPPVRGEPPGSLSERPPAARLRRAGAGAFRA